ncbi:MAG: tetratricopeptide repeat protein [Candidatus Eremiobacteraeota bacterium]|nr:tetratricopeptide repeat protein [Candidatus Eremiobacteraeota bacterium]
METARPTGTVTFLFTDIESSAELWERHPDAMRAALAEHDATLHEIITRCRGTVFKTVGDAFYCAFNLPEDAVCAAVAAQRALKAHAWPPAVGNLRVRMALHSGSAAERDGDYFGPAVNCVARLTQTAYGEQILVSSSTALLLKHSDVELRYLATLRLKGLSEPETIYQVIADDLRRDFPAVSSVESHANNLPSQISSFVGRSTELRELRELLCSRLVTIAGPGGMGKTRIALQLALDALPEYADGAWLVELAKVHDAALIPQTVAAALNLRESPQQPLQTTLLTHFVNKRALVILDNSEHLIEGIRPFVKSLLAGCSRLTLLITSREPLHIVGERIFRLSPMSNMPVNAQIRKLETYDSTSLFLDRARALRPEVPTDDAEARDIASICRKLEGIPLAIELAAARVTSLSLAQLNQRLTKKLALLVSKDPSEDERHRTLKGTIDWSYHFLNEQQQRFFTALSILRDSFTLEACEEICAHADDDAVDLLECLIDKSFVTVRHAKNEPRYHVLDTVREYAEEKLEEPARQEISRRHFAYYQTVAARDRSDAGAKATWLKQMETDSPNIRVALRYGLDQCLAQTATFLSNVAHYWQIRGHITEGRTWFTSFLQHECAFSSDCVALVLRRAAIFATIQDDYGEAIAFSRRARDLYASINDKTGEAEALHSIAVIEHRQGNSTAAEKDYREAAGIFREAEHQRGLVVALINLAVVSLERGELDRAQALLSESYHISETLNDPDITSTVLSYQGLSALRSGELDRANETLSKALATKLRLEDAFGIIEVENRLAGVRLAEGNLSEARRLLQTNLRKALKMEAHSLVIDSHERLAEVFFRSSNREHAVKSIRIARTLRERYCYRHASEVDLAPIVAALKAKRATTTEASLIDR